MSAIHEMSSIAVLPEMDLFAVPPVQISVSKTLETEYRPLSTLRSDAPIEFSISLPENQYLLLSETYLKLTIRVSQVNNDRTKPITNEDYANLIPANNLLHSMFKTIEVFLGNKSITQAPQAYSYRAYLETLLGFSNDSKKSHLTSALWVEDRGERGEYLTPSTDPKVGKPLDLMGKLHLDLTFQNRAIVGGTNLQIWLIPHDPSFYLENGNSYKANVEFLTSSLLVCSQEVTPFLLEGHSKGLSMATAKMPITRTEIRHAVVAKDSTDAMLDNLIIGQLPRRMFVCCVENTAFNGSFKKNPFYFNHFNINFIACYVNGIQVPSLPFQPDFENGLFIREYLALYRALDQNGTDSYLKLGRGDFKDGNAIFAFQNSPDLSSGCGMAGHVNPINHGSMRLQMKFSLPLPEAITVLIYCEYDNLIQIDETRTASTDYN